MLDHIFNNGFKGTVHLTCYETDDEVFSILEKNLILAKQIYGIEYTLLKENYITTQFFGVNSLMTEDGDRYDYIIGNPPYLKISKDAPEAKAIPTVCHGASKSIFPFLDDGYLQSKT